MKLTSRYDIEAPMAFVFRALTDFDSWERAAMRRGAEVGRTDKLRQPGVGMAWNVRFQYRGRDRRMDITLQDMSPETRLAMKGESPNIEGVVSIDLLDLAAKRTRLSVTVDVAPRTLGARLFLQSLRLARTKVDRRFAQRVAQLAADIEDRFRRSAPRQDR